MKTFLAVLVVATQIFTVSASAYDSKEIKLTVFKCVYRDMFWGENGYICKDATNKNIGKLVAERLELAGYTLSENAPTVLEITTDRNYYWSGQMQTQNGKVNRKAKAVIKNNEGLVIKAVEANENNKPYKSMSFLIDLLINKL